MTMTGGVLGSHLRGAAIFLRFWRATFLHLDLQLLVTYSLPVAQKRSK